VDKRAAADLIQRILQAGQQDAKSDGDQVVQVPLFVNVRMAAAVLRELLATQRPSH
jgi:hypothetical protein